MTVQLTKEPGINLLGIEVTGKLTKADYQQFVPKIEELIKLEGKLRILFEMIDFHGWTAGALWEDIKFDAKHFNDIERVALVGNTKWQEGMAAFCRPFTTAQVRYFPEEQRHEAVVWLKSD
jgi:hypothetical protein